MMYPYMTLHDETNVAHSHMHEDGSVKVYIEKPVIGGFHHATCWLPTYTWSDICGFTQEELIRLDDFVHQNAHLILQFAEEGGFENAASF